MKKESEDEKMIELFSGSGKISRTFREFGYDTFSVDIRRRKGVCEPDLRIDVLQLKSGILFQKPAILWAGVPCDIWSYASGGFHWEKVPGTFIPATEKAQIHIKLLQKTMQLIDELQPRYFFIENPRGKLRHYPPFIEWLDSKNAFTRTVTLSSYGFPTQKPTNIFTNFADWHPRPLDRYGRGAKAGADFSNFTKVQRQSTPIELVKEIAKSIQGFQENSAGLYQLELF